MRDIVRQANRYCPTLGRSGQVGLRRHGDYYAEDHQQQYLAKNPHGYRCHSNTGVRFPTTA